MRRTRIFLMIGAALFAILFLFSGVMAYRQYADKKQSAEAFEAVADLIRPTPVPQADSTIEDSGDAEDSATETEEAAPTQTAYETYAGVYAENNDFVGWISIDGTNINYPVMQTPNNPNFYLKHGFDKNYSDYGVPYVQENCRVGESDNCVIYGHHMNNGSMFADLCKFESEKFYQEHKTIYFDTLSDFGEYEIVCVFKTAAYSADGFKYYHFVDATDEAEFNTFLAECRSLALYDTGVTASYGDKLITLSTCEYSRANGRMVVVAKLVLPPADEVGDNG